MLLEHVVPVILKATWSMLENHQGYQAARDAQGTLWWQDQVGVYSTVVKCYFSTTKAVDPDPEYHG